MATFFFWVIVLLVVPGVLLVYFKNMQGKSMKKRLEDFMAENNFVPEYLHPYNLALDSKTRRVIFAIGKHEYAIYDLNAIKYLQKDDRKGVAAPIMQIIFTVNDLDRPRIFIPFTNFAERNVWYDRMLVV